MFDITLQPSGERYLASASDTILQALEQGGLEFPAFCRHGHCGLCRAELLAGMCAPDVDEPPAQGLIGPGEILICARHPVADLVLRLDWGPGRAPAIPARVVGITRLSREIYRLELRLPIVQPFTFAPGQFVLLRLKNLVRAYALANAPHERNPELHVHTSPGGQLETALAGLEVGHLVTIEGPFGQFYYRPEAGVQECRILLLAQGTGYAPMRSILRHLSETLGGSFSGRVELVWEAPAVEALYDEILLRRLEAEWEWFQYHPVVRDPDRARPPLSPEDPLTPARVAGAICYLAGPGIWVSAAHARLRALGVPEKAIYREPFGPDVRSASVP